METRASTHKVAESLKKQVCQLVRLKQLSTIDIIIAKGPELVMGNNSDRCFQNRLGATLKTKQLGKQIAWRHWEIVKLGVPTNNTGATLNINKNRAALPLVSLMNSILLLAEQQKWKVEAQHIPGNNEWRAGQFAKT
ncbi:MAG: hypothetical protein EZS28_014638 [Streblomastix strix]|uniref:Uncharacterized protein n=1 Tax=Streblomastix strix TaxID=222440 RepID=A0A5J4W5X3_9EUKA|nr:MAG: hypothetical protein EZS28_014638 [Streblomastix strix]